MAGSGWLGWFGGKAAQASEEEKRNQFSQTVGATNDALKKLQKLFDKNSGEYKLIEEILLDTDTKSYRSLSAMVIKTELSPRDDPAIELGKFKERMRSLIDEGMKNAYPSPIKNLSEDWLPLLQLVYESNDPIYGKVVASSPDDLVQVVLKDTTLAKPATLASTVELLSKGREERLLAPVQSAIEKIKVGLKPDTRKSISISTSGSASFSAAQLKDKAASEVKQTPTDALLEPMIAKLSAEQLFQLTYLVMMHQQATTPEALIRSNPMVASLYSAYARKIGYQSPDADMPEPLKLLTAIAYKAQQEAPTGSVGTPADRLANEVSFKLFGKQTASEDFKGKITALAQEMGQLTKDKPKVAASAEPTRSRGPSSTNR